MRRPIRISHCVWGIAIALGAQGVARGQSFVNWESPHVHPIDLTPDGLLLLAVNTADNRLELFDTSNGGLEPVASISVGLDPVSVRARSNTEAWVVNHVSDSISVVDLPSARVVATITTADEPADVVFAGTPMRAFVSLSQMNQVAAFDPANLLAPPTIIGIQGEDPRALAVSADGSTVFAAIFESGNHSTIIDQPNVSSPAGPYGGTNPPPNDGLTFNPPRPPGQPAPPPVSQIVRKNPAGQWMDDNGRDWSSFVTWDLHDHDVAMIDTASLAVTYANGLLTTVMSLAVSPSGDVTAIGTEAINELRFEPIVRGIFVRANLVTFDPASPATATTADLNPHLDYLAFSVPQVVRDESIGDPRAIAWHPIGDRAYVAGMGSNNVVVVDPSGARLGQIDVGQGPTGLAMSQDGTRLFVINKFDGSISEIDTDTDTVTASITFYDPTPLAIKLGRPFLYDTHATSGLGQLACASCHIDGRTDHLAWDLGDPSGTVKPINQVCRQGPGNCAPWHPMKGPMVTQTLQGIVGAEPLHWRGDREELAAFSVAFTGLQGADAEPSAAEMSAFTDFVSEIAYPPNPNRNIDGTLRNTLPTSTGNGNPVAGQNIYLTAPTLPGLSCNGCHALPIGSDLTLDDPPVGPSFQSFKIAQLRNMHEKTGFSRASLTNNRGFGFEHDGNKDGLFNLLGPPFNFPPGPPGAQQRRDVEAFMLSLATDTHPGIGQQVMFNGVNNGDAALVNRFNSFISIADTNQVGLVAKGRQNGIDRGYAYIGGNTFQSDRAGETINATTLRMSASAGNELTFTLVPAGSQTRIGIDRDEDGFFDRTERDQCTDPVDAGSTPPGCCPTDGDCDGFDDGVDNCPLVANSNQADIDGDNVGDLCDNCPGVANAGQEDANGDGIGDACQCPALGSCNDNDVCTFDTCSGSSCGNTPVRFGDVNGTGGAAPNLDDILCVLSGFGNFSTCPNADIAGCTPNLIINLDDLLAVMAAFAGADPCGCNP